MDAPGEIEIINRDRRKFWAHYTGMYNMRNGTYRYRVDLPEHVELSMVIIDVTGAELRRYIHNKKPIMILTHNERHTGIGS